MKNKPVIPLTAKSSLALIFIALFLFSNANPVPVNATCIPGAGGVIDCDSADDTVVGTTVTTADSTVTNTINGDGGDDHITGGSSNGNSTDVTNNLNGGDGNDRIIAGYAFGNEATMDNTLVGGAGNDSISGGNSYGADSVVINTITGDEGNDTIFPGRDRGTTNIIDGGSGTDTVNYSLFSTGVTIDLEITTGQIVAVEESTDTITNVENLTGSAYDDVLTGTSGDNVIVGNNGDDTIAGNGGKDTITGGEGSDTIILSGELGVNNGPGLHNSADAATANGGSGANNIVFSENTYGNIFLVSSSGLDTLDFSQYNAPITIDLSNSSPQLVAVVSSGSNPQVNAVAIAPTSNELWVTLSGLFQNVFGALNFTNSITGNSLDNTLTGGNQNDVLNGGSGSNVLNGGNGIDTDGAAIPVVGGVDNKSGEWNSIELPVPLPVETEEPPFETEEPPVETEEPPVVTETPIPPSNGTDGSLGVGGGEQGLIPVTGGLLKLNCGSNSFTLPNGDKVTISGLCGDYWVSLESLSSNLPGNLPDGKTMLSGIALQVYQGASEFDLTLVEPLPQGAEINFSFLLHEQNSGLATMLWGASGNWTDLGGGQVNGNYFDVSSNQNGTVALVK